MNYNTIIELMNLFIQAIASNDWVSLKVKLTMLSVIYTCVLIAMVIDLISGVRKAKQRGELRTSDGLKMTVNKAVRYYSLLILFTLVDIIVSLTVGVPYFTMIGGLFIVGIEIKSWFEKADEKDKVFFTKIIKRGGSRQDIADALADAINNEKENERNK